MKSFEDMLAWQEAKELVKDIFSLDPTGQPMPFKVWHSQLSWAALSIMNNLAEGFERGSTADMRRLFQIAKGSCAEVRSLLILGREMSYVSGDSGTLWMERAWQVRGLIIGLMRAISRGQGYGVKEEATGYEN